MSLSCAPGVRPDRAADGARDREPVLEPGQAGLLGLGRRARHRHAGIGVVALAVDARRLGSDLDDEPADPGVARSRGRCPRPSRNSGIDARAREAHERPQLEQVVGDREQVGRAADAHRREPRERLVARRLDADPALDVGADGERRRTARAPRVTRAPPGRRPRSRPGVGSASRGATASTRSRDRGRRVRAGRARGRRPTSRRGGRGRRAGPRPRPAGRRRGPRPRPGSRRPAAANELRVAPLVAGRVGVRDDRHRQRERRGLGERRGAGPARRRGRRRRAPRSSRAWRNGVRPVAVAERPRAAPRARRAPPRTRRRPVTCTTRTRSTSRGSAAGHRVVDPAHGLRAAEHEQDPLAGPAAERRRAPRRGRRPRATGSACRSRRRRGCPSARRRLRVAHREHRRRAGRRGGRSGPGTTLPSHSTLGIRSTAAASSVGIAT